jgi:hypothetical protein
MQKRNTPYTLWRGRSRNENGGAFDKMKINFSPRGFKILRGAILLIAVALLAYVGYAATTLSISNTGTVIIGGSGNWAGFTQNPGSPAPNCATVTYTQTPGPIAWGNLPNDGTISTAYICIQNSASARTASVTTSLLSPVSGVTVLYNGSASLTTPSIAPSGTFLVTVTVTVANTVAPTTPVTYTTTIQ